MKVTLTIDGRTYEYEAEQRMELRSIIRSVNALLIDGVDDLPVQHRRRPRLTEQETYRRSQLRRMDRKPDDGRD